MLLRVRASCHGIWWQLPDAAEHQSTGESPISQLLPFNQIKLIYDEPSTIIFNSIPPALIIMMYKKYIYNDICD